MSKHVRRFRLWPLWIVLVLSGYVFWALHQPLLALKPTYVYKPPAFAATKVDLDWPEYGQSAIGMAGYGVLETHGAQKPLATASIAKVMTALAVLRQRPLQLGQQGPTITLTQADIDSYNEYVAKDGSVIGVALGEQITEYQALQALLLPSANNMADTLARWAFGSQAAYKSYANDYAKQLGLNSMHINDASGYDSKTVASAKDLTLLGIQAMLNPVFAEIVGQSSATIPIAGTINNYNGVLDLDGNVGIKTGNNDVDRGAFLFAHKRIIDGSPVTIVGAIMGGDSLGQVLRDSQPLAASVVKALQNQTIVKKGAVIASFTQPNGKKITAQASDDLKLVLWRGITYQTRLNILSASPPLPKQATIGKLTFINTKSDISSEVSVQLSEALQEPSVWWRLTHPLGS